MRGRGNRSLVVDGRFRIAFVLFGAMVVLQSSPNLDGTKIAYLAGVVLCLLGALLAIWRARRTPEVTLATPWLAVSAALTVVLAVSFFVARANGTSITDWVRDVAAYGLFAAAPVFALDAQSSTSRKLLIGMLVVAGILGGFSWAFEWLNRRHIVELPLARLVFPSGQLPSLLYMFALATALTAHRRRAAWATLAGVILGLFLLTGTRSSLLLVVGPLAMAALLGSSRIRSSLLTLLSHGIVAVTLVLAFQLALALPAILGPGQPTPEPGSPESPLPSMPLPSIPSVLGDRFGSLPGVIGNPSLDASFNARVAQYRAAWSLFVASPIVGVGPGHQIVWVYTSGQPRTGFTADTPLVMPAKFGLLGILVFLGVAVAYGLTVHTAGRRDRRSVITLTLVGYGVLTIVGLPLGFVIEDKGASLSLMLLLALTFAEKGEALSIATSPSHELTAGVIERQGLSR